MAAQDEADLLAQSGASPPDDRAEGLFRAGCWLRRVSQEPALLFGGGRALLLEVAHPLVAAGVAQHSDFRRDPFGRLQRTLGAMGRIVFAERSAALSAVRSVEQTHERVQGTLSCDAGPFRAGTPYSGRDPELVLWVWATLADTALAVYQLFVAPLPSEAIDAWYDDQRVLARLLGVPNARVPASWDGFRSWFDGMLDSAVLTVTDDAREIGDAVLRLSTGPVKGLTASLLPARLREAFGLPWDEARARRVERLAASVRSLRDGAA